MGCQMGCQMGYQMGYQMGDQMGYQMGYQMIVQRWSSPSLNEPTRIAPTRLWCEVIIQN